MSMYSLLLWISCLGQGQDAAPSPEVVVERDVAMVLSDGTTLLADRWTPTTEETCFPALLIRTPYGRRLEERNAREWAGRGYCVVVQAVRGRDGSEGTWIPWENELSDGKETIDWIARQSWCTGRVGMLGGSYLGHVQILAAAAGHPALSCVVPLSPGSDGFSDVPFSGGLLKLGLISFLYACRGPTLDTNGARPETARDHNLQHLPLTKIDRAWGGFRSDIWQHWAGVETLEDMPGLRVWDHLAASEHKVPALHIGGVWDHESMGTRQNWEQFARHGGPHQYFIFGPWPHEPNQSTRYADVEYGEDAIIELTEIRERWYDHWLRGDSESALDLPRFQVFATGANRWLHLDRWPSSDGRARAWHITRSEASEGEQFVEGLSESAPEEPITWDWDYDPARIPSNRDLYFSRTTKLWFRASDSDALVLATPPFDEDTLLTGPVELELSLESSARDTDLFALLVEVRPNGEVRALHRPSPMRARFREGFDRAVPLPSGEAVSVEWALGDFAHRFEKGARLGLALRSDWFPTFARNLGTLEPMTTATKIVKQQNRIHSGPEHVSVLRLHELPLDRLENDGR